MPSAPHAADGQQAAHTRRDKRADITPSHIKQSSTAPGAQRRAKMGTEVDHHKNGPQGWAMEEGDSLGSNSNATSTLRKAVDEHKGIQGPARLRLTEEKQHHKTSDAAAHGHTKGAFTMQAIRQPAKKHAAPQADQAHSARHRGGPEQLQLTRSHQKRDEMDIDHSRRDGHAGMRQAQHPEGFV